MIEVFKTENPALVELIQKGLEGVTNDEGKTVLLRKYKGGEYTVSDEWLARITSVTIEPEKFDSEASKRELAEALKHMTGLEGAYIKEGGDDITWVTDLLKSDAEEKGAKLEFGSATKMKPKAGRVREDR